MPPRLRSQPLPPPEPVVVSAPPDGGWPIQKLAPELLLEIFGWDMAKLEPLPRQRRRFELAEVCHDWHLILQLDFEYVVPHNHKRARRLADRFKKDGTGDTVLRLSVQIGNDVGAVVALLRQCTHLLELRLVAPASIFPSVELEEAIKERKTLTKLELNLAEERDTWQYRWGRDPAAGASADFYYRITSSLPNLAYLDTGILRFPSPTDEVTALVLSSSSLQTLEFHLNKTSSTLLSALLTLTGANLTSLSLGTFAVSSSEHEDANHRGLTIASVLSLLKPLASHLLNLEWDPEPKSTIPWERIAYVTPTVDLSFLIALRHLELGSRVVAPCNLSACLSNISLLQSATVHLQRPWEGPSWTTEEAVQDIGDYVSSAATLTMLKLIPAWRKGYSSKKFDPEHHWDEEQLEWMMERASENGVRLVVSLS